ncbi:MAG: hypothetical protein U0M66_03905 [Bacilli bacterium]|nr:hypothetical protein [Bacilli bacterium]
MDDVKPKIKFYSMGSEHLDLTRISSDGKLDPSKPIKASKNFNAALRSVIQKDIDFLSKKIDNLVKEMTKRLAFNGTVLEMGLESNVESVDSLINEVETLISNLIIEKNSIKIGIFTSNKKKLRERISKLEDSVEFLSKYQGELIAIKNEYNKLVNRNLSISNEGLEAEVEADLPSEDPLERTINFYMKKQERN